MASASDRQATASLQGLQRADPGRGGEAADLAHTAGLAQGADGPHVALVPGAELRGVVAGGRVQATVSRQVTGRLQAERERGWRERAPVNTQQRAGLVRLGQC